MIPDNDYIVKHASYELIDPIISKWAKKNTLYIGKIYKEEEIRSLDTVDAKGNRFQIWFDPPIKDRVRIHASNYKSKHNKLIKDWNVKIVDLEYILEEVLKTIKSWMDQ